jgi:hypothetical protein
LTLYLTQERGLPVSQAASATYGWTEISSFDPKPPPQAEGMMRMDSGGSPMMAAVSSRSR